MSEIVFDIETDNLLPKLTKVHSLCFINRSTGRDYSCHTGAEHYTVEWGLNRLMDADVLIGHNIQNFDIPALQKVYPWFQPKAKIIDTLILSRLFYTNLKERDFALWKKDKAKFPGQFIGRHGLEAWGRRLGEHKGDYSAEKMEMLKALHPDLSKAELETLVWAEWSKAMQDYCEQDVIVTDMLWERMAKKIESLPNKECVEIEHDIRRIIDRQESVGFGFDEAAAARLYADLSDKRAVLAAQLQEAFPPWIVETEFIPKRNNKTLGYVEGVPFTKRNQITFNPSSRDHIADRLQKLRGWKPKSFTKEGKPTIDESILEALPYPEAKTLSEYLMIEKRIGQIAEGKQAWLKLCRDGSIFGRVNTNGAVTGRMTHDSPNTAQIPKVGTPYGAECRACYVARGDLRLVGIDADALELRCLAGYMAHYDGGEYIETVLRGDKSQGTDMHTLNAKALGCDRETAKTWFYAFIYGAGDYKLGMILGLSGRKAMQAGKQSRAKFLKALPALDKIVQGVKHRAKTRGFLHGLDGRPLHVRGEHLALNTLLQSAGAILMKKAQIILAPQLYELGGEFVGTIHDEWQIEIEERHAEEIGRRGCEAIRLAGEHFGFRCPLAGNFSVGRNWKETH